MNSDLFKGKNLVFSLIAILLVLFIGLFFKSWQFLLVVALAKGLVAIGLVLLLRCGLASFGQGLFYCVGAYAVGMTMGSFGVKDLFTLLLIATVLSSVIAWVIGLLLSRYRDIFFAMLTLAFSMIVYGLLIRNPALGGSDGFNVKAPSLFFLADGVTLSRTQMFIITAVIAVVCIWLVTKFLSTTTGKLGQAIKDNEIRVEYLGASARKVVLLNFVIAGALAGLGGGLSSFSIGHVDPDLAFWTTSGEFLFIAILGGTSNAFAPFIGAIALELIRTLSYQYAPNTWQIVMGASMLLLITFLPGGLISIGKRMAAKRKSQTKSAGGQA